MIEKVTFKITKDQFERSQDAHAEFHHAYGIAMAQWAGVESAHFYWFAEVTKMKTNMARAVFYSALGYRARLEMLEAAITCCEHLPKNRSDFISAALKRASGYAEFRNRMAHGVSTGNIIDIEGQPRKIAFAIVQPKSKEPSTESDIWLEDLNIATDNFHRLQILMMDFHPTLGGAAGISPEEGLRLVNALPTRANSKVDPNPSAHTPPHGTVHRNKKQFRASRPKRGRQ